jgi:hypothetical protein
VKRLVETSAGWIELEFHPNPAGRLAATWLGRRLGLVEGCGVLITRFDVDGRQTEQTIGWLSYAPKDDLSLGAFLADVAAVPLDEAERIASEFVDEQPVR